MKRSINKDCNYTYGFLKHIKCHFKIEISIRCIFYSFRWNHSNGICAGCSMVGTYNSFNWTWCILYCEKVFTRSQSGLQYWKWVLRVQQTKHRVGSPFAHLAVFHHQMLRRIGMLEFLIDTHKNNEHWKKLRLCFALELSTRVCFITKIVIKEAHMPSVRTHLLYFSSSWPIEHPISWHIL